MGMRIFDKSGIFYPANYGLNVGDTVDLVLVGGGGAAVCHDTTWVNIREASGTSFGTYEYAEPATNLAGFSFGGKSTGASKAGGGAGGFVPGSQLMSGDGFSGGTAIMIPSNSGTAVTLASPSILTGGCFGGFAGGGRGDYANINSAADVGAFGGAGYGAGGGGCCESGNNNSKTWDGGNSGFIKYASHMITADDYTNGIPVTVGYGALPLGSYPPCWANSKTNSAKSYDPHLYPDNIDSTVYQTNSGVVYNTDSTSMKTSRILADGLCVMKMAYTDVAFFILPGIGKFTWAQIFPGITYHWYGELYYCNGYYMYIEHLNATAGTTIIKAVSKSSVLAGNPTVQTVTIADTVQSIGANIVDLIVATSTGTLKVFRNWTPAVTAYDTVSLASGLDSNATGAYGYLYSDSPVTATLDYVVKSNSAADHRIYSYIANYETGSMGSAVDHYCRVLDVLGPYVMTYNSGNLYQEFSTTIVVYAIPVTLTTNLTDFMYFPNICNIMFTDNFTGILGYYTSNNKVSYLTYGYAGVPGIIGSPVYGGGGAGGCCVVMW